MPNLSELETLAQQAGVILRAGYGRGNRIEFKGAIDLVTEVDHQSEAFLLGEIRKRYPDHQILGEETGAHAGNRDHAWYVDPVDGTVNYAHGIPIFSVSIAYAFQGKVVLGVVYDPMRDETFSAERGKGAWLNGQPIRCAQAAELIQALMVTGFPYDIATTDRNNLEEYARFAVCTRGVRRLGSAAIDLCYIAAGRFDGYWELKLNPWDVAAGGLIAEEAGAKVTAVDGISPYLTEVPSLIAANPVLHGKMLAVLQDV